MSSKSKKLTSLVAFALLTLASCSTTHIKYPTDYDSTLYPNISGTSDNPIVENTWEEYYKDVLTSDNVYKNTVQQLLLEISAKAHNNTDGNNGTDVTSLIKDVNDASVMDKGVPTSQTDTNLMARSKKSMESTARSGSYNKDNLYMEKKYVESLKEAFTLNSDFDMTKINTTGKLVIPEMTYADIYGGDYATYMSKNLYDDLKINYLTSEYIYTKSFSSIGNSKARKVQIISLTDRTDVPGAAQKLLTAYIRDYVKGSGTRTDLVGTDPDFYVLSRLWKGITKGVISGIAMDDPTRFSDRYDSRIVVSDSEEQWLKDNEIIVNDESSTLAGKVVDDEKKLVEGYGNYRKVDSTLESTYTGSYTYDYVTGVRKAIDDIATKSLITKGIYLSADGLSSLPTTLKNRIFDTKLTTSKTDIAAMKNDNTVMKDTTVYEKDGYRYLTTADTVSTDDNNLVYYDTSSKTYYLTRILDVVSTNALSDTNTDTVYDTAEKREQIAREVAYTMSTTGSYKTESAVYWLRRTKISYSDDDFLTYMKNNYKDLFKTTSAYDSEPKILLS